MGAYDDLTPQRRASDAPAAPAAGGGAYADLAPAKGDSVDAAIKEGQARTATTPELIAANPIVRALTTAASPVMGIAEKVEGLWGGTDNAQRNAQLKEMQAKGANALGFGKGQQIASDVSGGMVGPAAAAALKLPAAASTVGRIVQGMGFGGASGLAEPGSDVMSGVKGGAAGGAITALIEGALKTPGLVKGAIKWLTGGATPKAAAAPSAGAADVSTELQRQRGVLENQKDVPRGASPLEGEIQNLEANTKPLRDVAFAEKGRINTRGALDYITMLEANNPDAKVRAALKEARETIGRATQGAQASMLPSAGTRMTPAELRALQGQGESMNVPMLDEVRQSINRQLSQKGEGALDAHTQDILASVREKLLEGAPQSYHKLLAAERAGRPALDAFDPQHSVLGKLTSGDRAYKPLSEGEAQAAINKALTGARKDRDLRELYEFTQHNPEAAAGFKTAYSNWLLDKNVKGGIDAAKVAERWQSSRAEMAKSGMFEPAHFAAIEKVMDDLSKLSATEGIRGAVGSALGFVLGSRTGHPIIGAGAGRQAAVNWGNKATQREVETLLGKSMADPEVAAILAGPPSVEAKALAERLISGATGAEVARQPPPRKPSVLGMKPMGI